MRTQSALRSIAHIAVLAVAMFSASWMWNLDIDGISPWRWLAGWLTIFITTSWISSLRNKVIPDSKCCLCDEYPAPWTRRFHQQWTEDNVPDRLKMENTELTRWKNEVMRVEAWWSAVDAAVRAHPSVTAGDTIAEEALRLIRERDKLVDVLSSGGSDPKEIAWLIKTSLHQSRNALPKPEGPLIANPGSPRPLK